MSEPCVETEALVGPYVDGELEPEAAEAFALHLASCAACRAALHDALQLVALESRVTAAVVEARSEVVDDARVGRIERPAASVPPVRENSPGAGVVAWPQRARERELARRGRGKRAFIGAAVALAAAAIVVALALPRDRAPRAIALATAPERSLEGRVSYAAADRHRVYAVARAGTPGPAADAVPLDALATLEQRGDRHGVAAGYLLRGDPARATAYLDGAAASPDVAADRALIQLTTGHPEEALIALDAVLQAAPRHPQALWNRALALRDLGLHELAADAFDAVAALREPGWAGEARTRAELLRAETAQRQARFAELVAAGRQLIRAPAGLTAELARRHPGSARALFYEAIRSAPTAQAVRALASLAETLDAIAGGTTLAAYVERIARADWKRRGPLAARYAALGAGVADPTAIATLLAAVRAAQQDDLVLATLVRAGLGEPRNLAAQLAELRRLADASHDAWLGLIVLEREARALLAGGDPAAAAQRLEPALAACPGAFELLCARLAGVLGDSARLAGVLGDSARLAGGLGDSAQRTQRLADARRVLADGLARSRRGNEWAEEAELWRLLAAVETDAGASRAPLAAAYLDERKRRLARLP